MREASSKFQSYAGRHILLIDVSQTGLDVEFHPIRPGGKPGLMAIWVANLPPGVANVHEIYLEPGIRVWTAPEPGEDPHSPPRRIRAGHAIPTSSTAFTFSSGRSPSVFGDEVGGLKVEVRATGLKVLREKRGLTQRQLAREQFAAGEGRAWQTISRYGGPNGRPLS